MIANPRVIWYRKPPAPISKRIVEAKAKGYGSKTKPIHTDSEGKKRRELEMKEKTQSAGAKRTPTKTHISSGTGNV